MTTLDKLVKEFEERIAARTKKTTPTFVEDFKTVISSYIAQESNAKKTQSKPSSSKRGDSDKKLNTWARIWVSTKYGGKTNFPQDYARIKEEAEAEGNKLTSFQILSKLRTQLETEESRQQWTEWYERVQRENPDAPTDPPTDRQAKKELKKKPAPAAKVAVSAKPDVSVVEDEKASSADESDLEG